MLVLIVLRFNNSFYKKLLLKGTSTFVAHGVRKNWFHLRGGAVKAFLMHLNLEEKIKEKVYE